MLLRQSEAKTEDLDKEIGDGDTEPNIVFLGCINMLILDRPARQRFLLNYPFA
jgi:hypothetical protein